MADFYTHITTSTAVGIGYGIWGLSEGAPPQTALLGTALCSVAGMMPDLDSDSGIPARESFAFSAAVIPALMLDRFQHLGWSNEIIALATGGVYFIVRFGVASIFKYVTVHRGMWHSIPACFTAGLLTFMICSREQVMLRIFLAVAVMLGFLSHLLLDEIWSISLSPSKFGLKSSWGTALKFFGDSAWGNFVSYTLLILCGAAAVGDPMLMQQYGYHAPFNTQQLEQRAGDYVGDQFDEARRWFNPPPSPAPPVLPWR